MWVNALYPPRGGQREQGAGEEMGMGRVCAELRCHPTHSLPLALRHAPCLGLGVGVTVPGERWGACGAVGSQSAERGG